jgi:hypothetical protein
MLCPKALFLKVVLFLALVPGVLFRSPGSFKVQLLVHGTLFAFLNHYLYRMVVEGFDNPSSKTDHPCPPNSVKCPSGDCKLAKDIYGIC